MLDKSFRLLFYLKKPKNYSKGEIPIYLRITVDGISKELSVKRSCDPGRWNSFSGIRKLIIPKGSGFEKPWLKNSEVRKLLSISSNTIQRLRIAGKLRSTKLGGTLYYRYEDIETLLNEPTKR
jgi:hypothetical protein